jgi:hypothetical protein
MNSVAAEVTVQVLPIRFPGRVVHEGIFDVGLEGLVQERMGLVEGCRLRDGEAGKAQNPAEHRPE